MFVVRLAYGAHELPAGSVCWLDERSLVFAIGRHLWALDVPTRRMVFLAKRQHTAPPFVAVFKRRIVVCETVHGGSSKAHVAVLDAPSSIISASLSAAAATSSSSSSSSTVSPPTEPTAPVDAEVKEGKGGSSGSLQPAASPTGAPGGGTNSSAGAHVLWRFSHPSIGAARCAAMTPDAKVGFFGFYWSLFCTYSSILSCLLVFGSVGGLWFRHWCDEPEGSVEHQRWQHGPNFVAACIAVR